MNRVLKYQNCSLLLLVVVLCVVSSYSQGSLFDKHRFEVGGYTLVGIFVHHNDHPLQKKVGEFYTDDIAVLNAIKRSWVFTKPQNQYACGYHYQFLILKDGVQVDSYVVNLECNQLVTDNGSVFFDEEKLEMYMPNLKTLKNERREFDSVTQARAFLEKLRKDQYFIYARPARWLIFEGEFRFKTRCPSDLGNNCYYIEHEEELVSKLRKEISKMFPAEAFELKASGGSSDGDVFVTVKCDRSLEEKFNLYDRWNRTGFGKWQPYHLTLNWYSKPHTLP